MKLAFDKFVREIEINRFILANCFLDLPYSVLENMVKCTDYANRGKPRKLSLHVKDEI